MQITQFYAIILRRNYAIYADITQILCSHYAKKFAIYADITQTLHRHYADFTQIHYANHTILRNYITQKLRLSLIHI